MWKRNPRRVEAVWQEATVETCSEDLAAFGEKELMILCKTAQYKILDHGLVI
jgi:hypothetical protein